MIASLHSDERRSKENGQDVVYVVPSINTFTLFAEHLYLAACTGGMRLSLCFDRFSLRAVRLDLELVEDFRNIRYSYLRNFAIASYLVYNNWPYLDYILERYLKNTPPNMYIYNFQAEAAVIFKLFCIIP